MKHLLKCNKCGRYTMAVLCTCGGKAATVRPPKYSPDDRFSNYRRKAKFEQRSKGGLL